MIEAADLDGDGEVDYEGEREYSTILYWVNYPTTLCWINVDSNSRPLMYKNGSRVGWKGAGCCDLFHYQVVLGLLGILVTR